MFHRKQRRLLLAALGGASLLTGVGPASAAIAAEFRAILSGENLPSGGDRDGWGRARIAVNDALNNICVDLEVRSVDEVTSARIHRGAAGQEGPPVVQLDTPDDNDSDDCDQIGDELADQIQANPAGYYVAVATREHPNGALRGQLNPGDD